MKSIQTNWNILMPGSDFCVEMQLKNLQKHTRQSLFELIHFNMKDLHGPLTVKGHRNEVFQLLPPDEY